MSDYAIVLLQGKQHKVHPGGKIITDKLNSEVGSQVVLDKVLLARIGDQITVGQPYLENLPLTATVLSHTQGEKLRIFKYKAKSRYRKTLGFRHQQTTLQVSDFGSTKSVPQPESNSAASATKTPKKTVTKSAPRKSTPKK